MLYPKAYQILAGSPEFKSWQAKNPSGYLSHFYCQLNSSFQQISPWEIGFYHPQADCITLFIVNESKKKAVQVKPPEKAFKSRGAVEGLDLKEVKTTQKEALELFQAVRQQHYPGEVLLNGFLILQKWENRSLWNISFACQSLQILNLKVGGGAPQLISHQLINFIERR